MNRNKKSLLADSYTYNQQANDLFSEAAVKNYKLYLPEAEKLRKSKYLTKSINNIEIEFKIKGKQVLTSYRLKNGTTHTACRKFNSIFANNDAVSELILELARAEINANLAKNGEEFKLYNFPGFGYISSGSERRKLNYRLRQLLKKPLFVSLAERFR